MACITTHLASRQPRVQPMNRMRHSHGRSIDAPADDRTYAARAPAAADLERSALRSRRPLTASPMDADPALERSFRGHRGAVNAVCFAPSMRNVVSGGADGDVLVWHFKPTLKAWRFAGHTGAVNAVAVSCAGLVASASQDHSFRLWQPSSEGQSTVVRCTHPVRAVDFSPDGTLLAAAGDCKTVKLYSVPKLRSLGAVGSHDNWVRSVKLSPDGRQVASGGDDRSLRCVSKPGRARALRLTSCFGRFLLSTRSHCSSSACGMWRRENVFTASSTLGASICKRASLRELRMSYSRPPLQARPLALLAPRRSVSGKRLQRRRCPALGSPVGPSVADSGTSQPPSRSSAHRFVPSARRLSVQRKRGWCSSPLVRLQPARRGGL